MGRENGVIYALGFFDGVHKGHQAILGEARKLAARRGLRAGVFTYENHPQAVVGGGAPPLLTTAAERRQIFAAQGMEEIVMTPFDRGFASQSPEEFIETLIGRYRCAGLCCGENFHFGARAAGDSRLLERLCVQKGLASRTAPPVTEGGRTVSSTLIRTLLREGRPEEARLCLGRPFSLAGPVIHGDGRGRTMGLPTINIQPPEGALLPAAGVYAAWVQLEDGRLLPGVTNVGLRPTFRTGGGSTVETNILGPQEDLYGRQVRLWLCRYLRGEKKFENSVMLIQQIAQDSQKAQTLLEQDGRGDIHDLF